MAEDGPEGTHVTETTTAVAEQDGWIRTVGQLRAKLADLPDDMLVVLPSVARRRSFSPLGWLSRNRYLPDSTFSGELLDDDSEPGRVEDEVPVVLLWPVS